jgi:ankyrin repeat protein
MVPRFLLPAIQISAVLEGRTLFERRENIRNFSSDLDSTFGETLLRIRKQPDNSSKAALKIIAWTHLTTRPLHVSEMFQALATNRGDRSLNWDNFQSPATWLKCCLGLVIVDRETSTVRLVHNSFAEYLERQGATIISFEDAHLQIAETCLTYLNLEDVSSYSSKEFSIGNQRDKAKSEHRSNPLRSHENDHEDILKDFSGLFGTKLFGYYRFSKSSISTICHKYSFVSYAAAYWGYHARKCERVPELLLKSASHYVCQPQSELKWSLPSLMLSFSTPPTWWDIPKRCQIFTGLHVASYFGLGPVVEEYCRSFCDPLSHTFRPLALNAPDLDGRTPLSWAAESGSDSAVQALLHYRGIDVDVVDRDNRTPLSWASANGHVSVVNLLLEYGAESRVGDEKVFGPQHTPLHLACHFGHTEVVKALLQHTARADPRNILNSSRLICSDPRPPLMLAAYGGYDGVVKLLIAQGVELDPRDPFGRTPLWVTVENNHSSTARLLLENGADAHAQSDDRTPLMVAILAGNLEMAELLLESGADIDQKANHTGTTALILAASHRDVSATEFLLDHGARVEIRDARGFTALTCASEEDEISVVELLVSRGAC